MVVWDLLINIKCWWVKICIETPHAPSRHLVLENRHFWRSQKLQRWKGHALGSGILLAESAPLTGKELTAIAAADPEDQTVLVCTGIKEHSQGAAQGPSLCVHTDKRAQLQALKARDRPCVHTRIREHSQGVLCRGLTLGGSL